EVSVERSEDRGVGLHELPNTGECQVERLEGIDTVGVVDIVIGESDDLVRASEVSVAARIRFRSPDANRYGSFGRPAKLELALGHGAKRIVTQGRSLGSDTSA